MLHLRPQIFQCSRLAKIQRVPLQVPSPARCCTATLTRCRSMHVLGNVANLVLYFSLPPSHTANLPAAAACAAVAAAVAVIVHGFVRSKK